MTNNTIKHLGIVENIQGSHLSVRIVQTSACAACSAKGHCSSADSKDKIIDIIDTAASSYQVGEKVMVVGMPIVAPLHTYVRNAIKELGIEAPNLHIMPPQNYLFFGYLINKAKGIITDSGNVAEEATFLGIPCITLNTYAEHPETWRMGTNELVGEDPALLAKTMDTLMHGEWKRGELPERWDGRTAERIVQILTSK